MRLLHPFFPAFLAAALCASSECTAQLVLPGAVGASPSAGANPAGAGGGASGAPPPKPKAAVMRTPTEASLAGRDLYLNGTAGGMAFAKSAGKDKDLTITRLQLKGDLISKPGEQCQVDVAATTPIAVQFVGKPAGLARYSAAIEACPFSFDVLDGAVLVVEASKAGSGKTCDWKAADCRVDPTGLWGPAGNGFSTGRIKELERERVRAETDMRANFRVLLHEAGKDKTAIKSIAGEQAGFSSNREMICRDYLREANHGFCALQLTEARSFALLAKIAAEEPKSKSKSKPKKKPATAALPVNP